MRVHYLILSIILVLIFSTFLFYIFHKQNKIEIELDESFCDQISGNLLINVCRAMILKDTNLCDNAGGYDTLCFDMVLKTIDVSEELCNNIENSYGKFVCYENLAVKTKNPEFCMNNDDCYLQLASISSDLSLCDFFPEGTSDKYTCLAIGSKNREYCERIENDFKIKLCLGYLPEDLNECVVEDYYNYKCLFEMASKEKDTTICEMIDVDNLKLECMLNIKNDFEICKNNTETLRDICSIYYLKNNLIESYKMG